MPIMELYLMRHGEAVSRHEWDRDDSARPLSEQGKKDLEAALPFIKKSGFTVEIAITSPYIRAKQTAEMICSSLGKTPLKDPRLASGASIADYKQVINDHKKAMSILIIGHMPDLAHFASAVTSDPWLLDDPDMNTAAIWALDPGSFTERWGNGKFLWKRNLPDWKKL